MLQPVFCSIESTVTGIAGVDESGHANIPLTRSCLNAGSFRSRTMLALSLPRIMPRVISSAERKNSAVCGAVDLIDNVQSPVVRGKAPEQIDQFVNHRRIDFR